MRLEGVTPSQNQWDKWHWSKRHAMRDDWFWQVKAIGRMDCNGRRAHVHITRVSKRLIDPLNVHSGCKGLLDALVEYGYIRGDAAKDITIQVDQEKGDPHMEVEITYEE